MAQASARLQEEAESKAAKLKVRVRDGEEAELKAAKMRVRSAE